MKLRCTENSIRIRIRKSELNELAEKKLVEEKIHFGNQKTFTFALSIENAIRQVDAFFVNDHLKISLPQEIARQWISSNQVSIEANNKTDERQSLHILVEKDFPCLDRPGEDKSDTFWELASDTPDACQ